MTTQIKAYSYIRFSTVIQKEGDSERRQKELVEKYLKDHPNLTLDTTLNMQDSGLSAYHGVNRTKGALGAFLKLVENGKIEKGSFLLVENLDRLSRQEVLEALNQFTSIIQAGIKIVTLQDGIEYTQESINANFGQLLMSIVYMSQAHQESEKKSLRLKASWESKRQNTTNGKGKLTGRVPQWIKVKDDKSFELIPDVCETIKSMFLKKLSGKGDEKIVQEINITDGVWQPPKSKRNKTGGWKKSTVSKILTNRQLIGEYQPCKMVDGKRQETGEVIENYFPKAIEDESLFFRVQALISTNSHLKGNSGGKTGKVSNVFTHVIQCGLCGGAMHYIDKGQTSKGGQYLECASARNKLGCTAKAVRYEEFFDVFFDNLNELDINQIIPEEEESKLRIIEINKIIEGNKGQILRLEKRMANTANTMADIASKSTRIIYEERNRIDQTIKGSLENQNGELLKEKILLTNQKRDLVENIDRTKQIHQLLDSAKNEDELIRIRLKLRQEIRKLIEWIRIYPIRKDEEKLIDLKLKYKKAMDLIKTKKEMNEKIGLGLKMHITALKEVIHRIESSENDEYGIVKIMDSKYIDKVRIKFRGSKNHCIFSLIHYEES